MFATFGDGARHLRIVVMCEVLERRARGPLLALKEHGNEGAEQNQSGRDLGALESDRCGQPLALRAIAYLIVILNEAEKSVLRQGADGPPMRAAAMLRVNAVVDEGVFDRFRQLRERTKIRIVSAFRG